MPAPEHHHPSDGSEQPRPRPPKEERQKAVTHLLVGHGRALKKAALRFALDPDDADDAFQRALEIALEKAPTTDLDELVPWLRTVIKHEAFALTRKRTKAALVSDQPKLLEHAHIAPSAAEDAEVAERLAVAAEALRQLKPQEARALRLKIEGYSYREICAQTGWSYTKVNRCLTEGRASLRRNLASLRPAAR
jgi:RNA polymerase sigma factor (sigma-70 family)